MKINSWLSLVCLAMIISAVGIIGLVQAGPRASIDGSRRDRATAVKIGFPPPWNWMADQWTGSDRPYADTKVAINAIAKNGGLNRAVLAAYQEQARRNPKDSTAQYRWGYAFETALNDGTSIGTVVQNLDTSLDIAWGLQQVPSPHSYEYTRLLFLNSAKRSMYKLIPLARRLLQHTPDDYAVEFFLCKGLASATTLEGKEEALAYAQKLIKKYPNRGGPYGALAEVYSAQWEKGDVQSGPLAMAAYQKYLSMPPKGLTPQDRQGLEYWMNFIRTHPSGPKGPKIK